MPTEENVTRKLRAILSADVKGYSLLMSDDEAFTVRTLKSYRKVMSAQIVRHKGRVVDAPGDNLLAEFASVVDAVTCAVEIQKILKTKNQDLPFEKRLEFRIGVNIGDVIQDGDSIYGAGVNVAARIEGLADPGGICISRNAYDHIRDKLDLGYEYLGDHNVKNIKHPVRVYKVLMGSDDAGKLIGEKPKNRIKKWVLPVAIITAIIMTSIVWHLFKSVTKPDIEIASIENMALQLPDKPSIAVLPFDNFSKDPGQEYIADGITENIITTLSKTAKLFVIARNSVFTYKGKAVSVKQVSEDLGVRYVLEGSVQISDKRIRITAQLIDAIEGNHIWAQKYDKKIDDIFLLQDDISQKILEALRVELTEGEQAVLIGGDTNNLDAYLSFLKGLEKAERFNKEGNMLARKAAQAAIEIDPMYPSGYRLLAFTHLMDIWFGASKDPKFSIKKAFELLEKVHLLDENSPGYYYLMGQLLLLTRQHDKAIKSGERSVNLSPNNAAFIYGLAIILKYNGEFEKALVLQKKAMRLNPYPTSAYYLSLGDLYLFLGKYEESIQAYKKSIHIGTDQFRSHLGLAAAYSQLDLKEEAKTAISEAHLLRPNLSIEWAKTLPFRNKKDLDFYVKFLEKAGLPKHPPLPLPDKPSIAVLAFDNLSGDPEQEYFSDGITEEIISALSKTDQLFVIARNSSFAYKGKPVNVKQISRELGVRFVLEGSVRKSENQVRIIAQLINATTGHHLWSERYDRDLKDIFAVQDDITMKIITALQVELTEGDQMRMWAKGYKRLDVQLKAMELLSLWREGSIESLMRHGQVAQETIDMAPDLPVGYRSLGWHHWGLAIIGKSPRENLKKAYELAQKAISMDESDGMSYGLLNGVYQRMKQFEKAIAAGERSVELNPNGAQVNLILGQSLLYAGRPDEAIEFINKAIRLNPFPPYLYPFNLGHCYLLKRQYEKALTEYKKAVQIAPKSPPIHVYLAVIYALLDRENEARASAEKALELAPFISVGFVSKTSRYGNEADLKLVIDAIRKAGFPE